jgi:hypothetical protein
MAVLCWGGGIVCVFFLLHCVIWRVRLPKYQTRALLGLCLGTLLIVLAGLAAGWYAALAGVLPMPAGRPQYFQIALFVIAFGLAYIITYSALEADSPTLVMVQAIARAESTGLAAEDFHGQMSDAILVEPRIADLIRDGMVVEQGDRYAITRKGRRFVGIFIRFRCLLGLGKGG